MDKVADKTADKKRSFLADMLLHMVADKVASMGSDNLFFLSWLTWSWTWWPTRR